ncbi:hypothetical protein [Pseudomonas petrae]|uniref:Sporulation related domain-containing protein n=1 Tax=Pseudomonas petrae TaxID=2912190 RepID=A0ABS9IC01_9PSED|nr:hypothetical protein [Pseudomonas petrae]MCF7534531.1 hypothetical protein [Pseudomonas petrae]MCF7539291.1 hypothetical protein [Pseudomonas petrae]MCF7544774.1 hypothetical protein [Pseudomonas petrae]MCF7558577.1 hypothetical protein [Pseudomonas petrae]
MPWAFLLLIMLNGLYFVWHQQDAPLRPKEVEPLLTHRAYGQDIRLLSESGLGGGNARTAAEQEKCLYLGGSAQQAEAVLLEQRLVALDIDTHLGERLDQQGGAYWLRIAPASRRLVSDALIAELRRDFPMLKNEIMSCEGIATAD